MCQFRSPHERTPDAYCPTITNDGRSLAFNTVRRPNWSKDPRFKQYGTASNVTGYMVGPGTYKDNQVAIAHRRIPGGPIYRSHHKDRKTENNCYFMVNNTLVFDQRMEKAQRRSLSMSDRVDAGTALLATRQSLQRDMEKTQFSASSRPMTIGGSPAAAGNTGREFWKQRSQSIPEVENKSVADSREGKLETPERQTALEKSPYLSSVMKDDNIAKMIRAKLSWNFNKRAKAKV